MDRRFDDSSEDELGIMPLPLYKRPKLQVTPSRKEQAKGQDVLPEESAGIPTNHGARAPLFEFGWDFQDIL
jgi:hypothetical protein